jgi:hypothetical protein
MFYKVISGGVVIEFTRKRSEAEAAFKDSGRRDRQVWKVGHNFAQRVM